MHHSYPVPRLASYGRTCMRWPANPLMLARSCSVPCSSSRSQAALLSSLRRTTAGRPRLPPSWVMPSPASTTQVRVRSDWSCASVWLDVGPCARACVTDWGLWTLHELCTVFGCKHWGLRDYQPINQGGVGWMGDRPMEGGGGQIAERVAAQVCSWWRAPARPVPGPRGAGGELRPKPTRWSVTSLADSNQPTRRVVNLRRCVHAGQLQQLHNDSYVAAWASNYTKPGAYMKRGLTYPRLNMLLYINTDAAVFKNGVVPATCELRWPLRQTPRAHNARGQGCRVCGHANLGL